jgi:hypothetical protein
VRNSNEELVQFSDEDDNSCMMAPKKELTPMNDDDVTSGDPFPEQIAEWEREDVEFAQFIDAKVKAGWVWDNSCLRLSHRKKAGLSIDVDSLTREQTYSEQLNAQLMHLLLVNSDDLERIRRAEESLGFTREEAVAHFIEASPWSADMVEYKGGKGTPQERLSALRALWRADAGEGESVDA